MFFALAGLGLSALGAGMAANEQNAEAFANEIAEFSTFYQSMLPTMLEEWKEWRMSQFDLIIIKLSPKG